MDKASQIGDFTIFGFSKEPSGYLQRRISERLGVTLQVFNFDASGSLFFYTTYGEVAEREEALALKLGFLRSPEMSPLSAQQLLDCHIVKPRAIDNGRLRGNALVACLGKNDCSFSAYKTLLGVPQLYYSISDHEIICSDRLKCVVMLLDHVELNEDVVPMHFLFRSTPGNLTYYRQIQRMLPGHFLKWVDGRLSVKLVQDLNFTDGSYSINHADPGSLDILYKSLKCVVGDCVTQVEASGQNLATLLSGGVDSSLIQYLIDQQTSHSPPRSFSFAIRVPSYEYEIEYARESSQLFHTEHTFVDFKAEDYPGLLTRAIDILAQPPVLEIEPSMLSIAEFAQAASLPARYFFSGQGADTVFGLTYTKKLKVLHTMGKIPGASLLLKGLGTILRPVPPISRVLLKGSGILDCKDASDAFISPSNSIGIYGDLNIIRRCFGDEVVRKALQYRRAFASEYLDTNHYLEQVHVVDLMTDTYEIGVQTQQLFLAHQREQLYPFFDEDILRLGFAFNPDIRYIRGLRSKYLLKELLEQQTGSSVARKPKGFSVFEPDLIEWMKSGPLRPMVQEIQLPGFLSKNEFERELDNPGYFLWILLNFDIFKRRCLT